MEKRIVITGLGAVTPIGNDVITFWQSLVEGHSGVGLMKADTSDEKLPYFVADVKDFDATKTGLHSRKLKLMGRTAQLMLGAVAQASREADLDSSAMENLAERCGIIVGVGMLNADITEFAKTITAARKNLTNETDPIDVESFSKAAETEMVPLWLLRHIPNMVAAHSGISLKTRGISNTIMNGCASAAFAVGEAARIIRRGDADVMFAGGVDARTNTFAVLRYLELGWQTKETDDSTSASKPFDHNATGFVSGEASGVIVLESLEHAEKRGAKILAEIGNCGFGNDAFDVLRPEPEGRGLTRAISKCVSTEDKNFPLPEVVFSSASGVPEYDSAAAYALRNSFEKFVFNPTVTATRSILGHTHAASFALDAIAAVKSLDENIVPPTLNLLNPIADFDFVTKTSREMPISSALVTGYGIGGHAGAVTLRRFEQ